MGLRHFSESVYTYRPPAPVVVGSRSEKRVVLPNPNPKNFEVIRSITLGRCLVLKVRYPDCTNYEGNKILVYQDTKLADLFKQGSIDPHFCNNHEFKSPIARFVPTDEGWRMAETFATAMNSS